MHRRLSKQHQRWATREGFVIAPYECLSACTRPCVVALRAPNKYTYVFGDLTTGSSESAIIECATLYRRSPTDFMEREQRPPALRNGILSRVPPLSEGWT